MKKRRVVYVIVVVMIAVAVIGIVTYLDKKDTMEFEILTTVKSAADNFQSVDLSVVVNVKNYDKEEMLSKVRDYYYEMNGEVDKLDIRLYDSREDFETNNTSAESSYQKEE